MNLEVPDSSEDCLYLNVYTPSKPGANDKLPVSVTDLDKLCCIIMEIRLCILMVQQVMVWIHGGGLSMAAASLFDGHVLAAYQDVVVVLIQYRLGLLGFFR